MSTSRLFDATKNPIEAAAEELQKAALDENERLFHEQSKLIHQWLQNRLNDALIHEKNANKKQIDAINNSPVNKYLKNENIEKAEASHRRAIAAIKKSKSNLKEALKKIKHGDDIFHHLSSAFKPLDDLVADEEKKPSAFTLGMKERFENEFLTSNREFILLRQKSTATTALYKELDANKSDLFAAIQSAVDNNKEAFAALNKRRGESKFWKVIDSILAKLKKSASKMGVKSASFEKKINQSLFKVTVESHKKDSANFTAKK